jgi:hypothetical protein
MCLKHRHFEDGNGVWKCKKVLCQKNDSLVSGCWRLTPVILATQEAESRMILVQSQPGQIVLKTLSPKKNLITKIELVE